MPSRIFLGLKFWDYNLLRILKIGHVFNKLSKLKKIEVLPKNKPDPMNGTSHSCIHARIIFFHGKFCMKKSVKLPNTTSSHKWSLVVLHILACGIFLLRLWP